MKIPLGLLALVGLLLVIFMKPLKSQDEAQADLERRVDETVREFGTVESAKSVGIVSELAGEATILRVVPDGTAVKEGDLLVTLDDTKLQQSRNETEIELQAARTAVVRSRSAGSRLRRPGRAWGGAPRPSGSHGR